MALLVTKDNRPHFVAAEQANLLWLAHTGERSATPKTMQKVKLIAKWFLNPATAPQSWVDSHPDLIQKHHRPRPVHQARLPYVN